MTIITRAEWGASQRAGFDSRPVGRLERWLHHSVTTSAGPNATQSADAATIRNLEGIGQKNFGGGISYTFAITEAGRVFEGTGVTRRGSHTAGRNTISAGLVLVGNYQNRPPTDAQLAALVWLLHHGVSQGWWTSATLTGGHRDVYATACPGAAAYALIPAINAGSFPISPALRDWFTMASREDLKVVIQEVLKEQAVDQAGIHGIVYRLLLSQEFQNSLKSQAAAGVDKVLDASNNDGPVNLAIRQQFAPSGEAHARLRTMVESVISEVEAVIEQA